MGVHAGGQAVIAVRGQGIGGHGNDGQRGQLQLLAHHAGGGKTVQHRHLDVHQHGVELLGRCRCRNRVHAQLAIGRQRHQGALGHQQLFGHLLVDQVVLHHQNAHAGQAPLTGRRAARLADARARGAGLQCRLQQHGGGHRLHQKAVEQVLLFQGALLQRLAAVARDHHQHRLVDLGSVAQLAQARGGGPAVQARHMPVQVDHIKRADALVQALLEQRQRRFAAGADLGRPAPGLHHAREQLARHRVAVHHQGAAQFGMGRQGLFQLGRNHVHQWQLQAKVEGAAHAQGGAQAQLTAHQFHHALADGQAQAGAAELARG